jgi:8-oxo-dGTP pyrophosphatase MutT (NUDIX family)
MKISKDAQAVIIKKENGNVLFLVIKRFDKDKQEDHYRLVKGGIEEGESAEQAAKREVLEEVGIKKITKSEFLTQYEYVGGEVKHEVEVFILTPEIDSYNLTINSTNEGGFTIKEAVWMNENDAKDKLNFTDEKKLIEKAVEKIFA